MKLTLAVLVLSLAVVLAHEHAPSLDQILADEELQQKYFGCLVDKAPCTPGATKFKQILAATLTNDCAGCSAEDKASALKVIKFAQTNKPDLLKAVEQKYDPSGAYRARTAA